MKKTKMKVPDFTKIIRGTLIERYTLCGNKNCNCHKKEKKHGPHWYIVYSEENKTHHVYIPKSKVGLVQEYIKNYHYLKKYLNVISKKNVKNIKEKEVVKRGKK